MERYRAIPSGYMTVGEAAKKMGVTVRTLQYYDREGVLCPSSVSEGGRRLYSDKDIVELHRILSLKSLGFSLEEIKNRLPAIDTPEEVAAALTGQARTIQQRIDVLTRSLRDIDALKAEVLQMRSVDFKKYADIIVNLQMKNDRGVARECEEGQTCAKEFWQPIAEFTGGDGSLRPRLMKMGDIDTDNAEWNQKQEKLNAFLGPALEVYFRNAGVDPFGGTK